MQRLFKQYSTLVLLTLLCGHFVFIKLVSEPYPALILPGFGTPPKEGNLIECEITTAFLHYPKGDSIELSVPLMLDLPFPYARLKMNKIFAEG